MRQRFGGNWTEDKLDRVRRYLVEWTKVMMKQSFTTVYIDAFAGTGYREQRGEAEIGGILPELAEEEPQSFLDGSARIALQINPEFDRYIFIELNPSKASALEQLKLDFQDKAQKITIITSDSNTYLRLICKREIWKDHRAVLFLDPFGMEVTWDTIEDIAQTQAIDLWYLFPLGIHRLLTRSGKIPEHWKERLSQLFGTSSWREAFYRQKTVPTLFGEEEVLERCVSFPLIEEFLISRLRSIFPGVANNPLTLCNSRGTPLFLLCFAVSNPSEKARGAALRIAEYILRMR